MLNSRRPGTKQEKRTEARSSDSCLHWITYLGVKSRNNKVKMFLLQEEALEIIACYYREVSAKIYNECSNDIKHLPESCRPQRQMGLWH